MRRRHNEFSCRTTRETVSNQRCFFAGPPSIASEAARALLLVGEVARLRRDARPADPADGGASELARLSAQNRRLASADADVTTTVERMMAASAARPLSAMSARLPVDESLRVLPCPPAPPPPPLLPLLDESPVNS